MKFKVGDKVKIIGNNHSIEHFFKIGSIGTVLTSERGPLVKVGKEDYYVGDKDLELLSSKKKSSKPKKVVKKKEKVLAQVTIDSNLLGEEVTAIMKNSGSEKIYIKVSGRWFVEA